MGLFHFDYQKPVVASKAEQNQYVQLLKSRVDPRTFKKLVEIFDKQIAAINPSKKSALSFGMLATLVGYNSTCPTKDSTYVWDKVWEAAGKHQKTANYMLGTLAQWRFAEDDREWYCCKNDQHRQNEEGEDIYVTIYWIPPPAPKFSLSDLKAKWASA